METLAFLVQRVNLDDYPNFAACDRSNEYPALSLCEYYAATGMRYAVPAGYAIAVGYFYLFYRRRLSFADREIARLHHFFYPSAGYSTPVGLLGGISYGMYHLRQDLTSASLASLAQREKAAAVMSAGQYHQRRSAALQALSAEQSLWSRLLVALRLSSDPVAAELQRLGLGDASVSWRDLLIPHGYLWTSEHSTVHIRQMYKDYVGPLATTATAEKGREGSVPPASPFLDVCEREKIEKTDGAAVSPSAAVNKKGGGTVAAAPVAPFAVDSAALSMRAMLTKPQVDFLVSRIATMRTSADEDRWMTSASRFGCYGIIGMMMTWNSRSAIFRLQMGLGLGVTVGACISALRLDETFVHL